MAEDFATCCICMETYDLDDRIPKSLDCRHSLCALCLASQCQSQKCCPVCRRPIDDPDKVINDLTMIDYLERQQHQKRMEQQKAIRDELLQLINGTESEYKTVEKVIHKFQESKSQTIKDKSNLFKAYVKSLFQKSLDACNCEIILPTVASQYEGELHNTLQEVQLSLVAMRSLLEQESIAQENFEHCQNQASRAVNMLPSPQIYETRLWDAFLEQLVEQFSEVCKETTEGHPEFLSQVNKEDNNGVLGQTNGQSEGEQHQPERERVQFSVSSPTNSKDRLQVQHVQQPHVLELEDGELRDAGKPPSPQQVTPHNSPTAAIFPGPDFPRPQRVPGHGTGVPMYDRRVSVYGSRVPMYASRAPRYGIFSKRFPPYPRRGSSKWKPLPNPAHFEPPSQQRTSAPPGENRFASSTSRNYECMGQIRPNKEACAYGNSQNLDYNRLTASRTLRTEFASRPGRRLWSLCAVSDLHLMTVEDVENGDSVCLYEVTAVGLTLLDSNLRLEWPLYVRCDSSGRIYVSNRAGVTLFRIHSAYGESAQLYEGRLLTGGGRLKCARGLAVVSDTTLCVTVSGTDSKGVYLLDRITDTILNVLQPPVGLENRIPFGVASFAGSIIKGYQCCSSLVLYPKGETVGTLLRVQGLGSARRIAVDPVGRFLVADTDGSTVWVLSVTGKVLAKVDCDKPCDITLSSDNSRLCIGNRDTGEITVLQ